MSKKKLFPFFFFLIVTVYNSLIRRRRVYSKKFLLSWRLSSSQPISFQPLASILRHPRLDISLPLLFFVSQRVEPCPATTRQDRKKKKKKIIFLSLSNVSSSFFAPLYIKNREELSQSSCIHPIILHLIVYIVRFLLLPVIVRIFTSMAFCYTISFFLPPSLSEIQFPADASLFRRFESYIPSPLPVGVLFNI